MKTVNNNNVLNLEKFQIAKLNNLNRIRGGKGQILNASREDEENTTETIWTYTETIYGLNG